MSDSIEIKFVSELYGKELPNKNVSVEEIQGMISDGNKLFEDESQQVLGKEYWEIVNPQPEPKTEKGEAPISGEEADKNA